MSYDIVGAAIQREAFIVCNMAMAALRTRSDPLACQLEVEGTALGTVGQQGWIRWRDLLGVLHVVYVAIDSSANQTIVAMPFTDSRAVRSICFGLRVSMDYGASHI